MTLLIKGKEGHGFVVPGRTPPVSLFSRRHVEEKGLLREGVRIADAGSKKGGKRVEDLSEVVFYRDDLVSENAMLFAGATNQSGITSNAYIPHIDYSETFWKTVASQPHFGEHGWQDKTLLAESVMIKALAQLAHTFHASREKDPVYLSQFFEALKAGKTDFTPENPLWVLYLKSDAEREAQHPGLAKYLTSDAARRAYATMRDGRLDFAINTHDIARYLGDLIRWELKLPPWRSLLALRNKLASQGKPVITTKAVVSAAAA